MQSYDIENEIVRHYAGSISYGTNLPTSDVDVRGVFCAGKKEICTPFFPVREVSLPDHEDGKLYELSTFMKLYLDCNPNIIETLWVDDSDIISSSWQYELLQKFRQDLLSSKVAFTFSGYALSQLKRIKGHNKWINNPQPKEKPQHRQFLKMVRNFGNEKILPRDFDIGLFSGTGWSLVHYGSDIYGIVYGSGGCKVLDSKGDFNISAKQDTSDHPITETRPRLILKYISDEYKKAKENHRGYWEWKDNRNQKRSELEEEFGYDTKHAMHLVRLLRMGEEILSGEGVIVKRPDADELLSIRAGSWGYEKLVKYAEMKDNYIRGELYKNTDLRKKPNIKLAADILMRCQHEIWD